MSGLEHARGQRLPVRNSPFPDAWGGPPLDLDERAGWIAANLAGDLATKGSCTHVRSLGSRTEPRRTMDARQALVALRARESGPV